MGAKEGLELTFDDMSSSSVEIKSSDGSRTITVEREKYFEDNDPVRFDAVTLDHLVGGNDSIEVMSFAQHRGINPDQDTMTLLLTAIADNGEEPQRPDEARLCTVYYDTDGVKQSETTKWSVDKNVIASCSFLRPYQELPDRIDFFKTAIQFQIQMLQRDFTDPPLILHAPVLSGQVRVAL